MSIAPTFSFSLGQAVLPGPVAVGKLDGSNMSLICAASGGRVVIHTASGAGGIMARGQTAAVGTEAASPLRLLSINRDVKSLACTPSLSASGRDVVLVGTTGSLQAYDVHENVDLFRRETSEPVTALAVGAWPYSTPDAPPKPDGLYAPPGAHSSVIFAGGNCSVTGCYSDGSDAAWMVAGDVVTAAAVADVDGDGRPELLVGAADAEIRVLQGEAVVAEISEGDRVTCLAPIPLKAVTAGAGAGAGRGGAFAFALANGTVGVYGCGAAVGAGSGAAGAGAGGFVRLWKAKVKSRAVSVTPFDFDGDGVPELACGWASGRLEIRRAGSGELLFREQYPTGVAGLVVGDYRSDGSPVLIVVTTDGNVRAIPRVDAGTLHAYRVAAGLAGGAGGVPPPAPLSRALLPPPGGARVSTAAAPSPLPSDDSDDAIAALLEEKQALEALLRGGGGVGGSGLPGKASADSLPSTASVRLDLLYDHVSRGVELSVSSSHPADVVVRGAVVVSLDTPVFVGGTEACAAVPGYQTTVGVHALTPQAGQTLAQTPVLTIPLLLRPGALPGPVTLTVTAVLASRASAMHAAAITRPFRLPPFLPFQLVPGGSVPRSAAPAWDPQAVEAGGSLPLPSGSVSFTFNQRAARVASWVSHAFSIAPLGGAEALVARATPHWPSSSSVPPHVFDALVPMGGDTAPPLSLDVRFVVLRQPFTGGGGGRVPGGSPARGGPSPLPPLSLLRIAVASEAGGPAVIQCNDLSLAGEVVQSLAAWAGVVDLESTAHFPAELEAFSAVLQRVADGHAVRTKLTGEMAEASSLVKTLVVEAEDARLLEETRGMRAAYSRLGGVTGDLLGEYRKRAGAHEALMSALREVNSMIARAAGVRVGEAKGRVVAACRAALKAGNTPAMLAAVVGGGR